MAKDDFKGCRVRFDKAAQTVREITTFSACPECGMPMECQRTYRHEKGAKATLYRITGLCPKGHKIARYGYGEAVA